MQSARTPARPEEKAYVSSIMWGPKFEKFDTLLMEVF